MPEEIEWQSHIIRPNLNLLSDTSVIDGYSSLILRDYQQYFGLPSLDPTSVNLSTISPDQLRTLGVKYIVSKPGQQETFGKSLWVDEYRALYEQPTPSARVHWQDGGTDGVTVHSWRPNTVQLTVTTKSDNTLVMTDIYVPGWYARLDGRRVPIIKEAGVFKSIAVPAGTHSLVVYYFPLSLLIGIMTTLVGLGVYLLAIVRLVIQSKSR